MLVTTAMLERLERAAVRDLMLAPPAEVRRELGLEASEQGGALVLRARGVDSLLFNRVIGWGVQAPVCDDVVRGTLDGYGEAGIERFFVHVHPGSAGTELRRRLEALGLRRYPRSWIKLVRGQAPPRPARCSFEIVPARAEHASAVGRLLADAFDVPPPGRLLYESLVRREGWHVYVALDGETVAAAGTLFVQAELGYLACAATAPSYRGRGAQSALIEHRIAVALEHGCVALVTETGEEVEGERNPSQDNLERAGFRVVASRDNYALPGVRWSAGAPRRA